MTIQTEARRRVLAAMERRKLTPEDVARLAGVVPRTVERFVRGHTFGTTTLAKLERALGLARKPANDRYRPMTVRTGHEPVVGWEQAAHALRVSVRTLRRQRRRHGDETPTPWWGDVDELKRWYATMIAVER